MINTDSERPIGHWLKKLDRLIDAQFERQLGEAGLSRRQWQLRNPRLRPRRQSWRRWNDSLRRWSVPSRPSSALLPMT